MFGLRRPEQPFSAGDTAVRERAVEGGDGAGRRVPVGGRDLRGPPEVGVALVGPDYRICQYGQRNRVELREHRLEGLGVGRRRLHQGGDAAAVRRGQSDPEIGPCPFGHLPV